MSLEDVIKINITRETKVASRQGFGTVMILGIHKAFTGKIRFYATPKDVLVDFELTDKEYIAANTILTQKVSPKLVAIGRRETSDTSVVTVAVVANTTKYSITINGTKFEFTSDGTATAIEIAAGLKIAVDAGSEPVTFTDNTDGTYDIDPTVAGTDYSLKADSRQTIAYNTSDTIPNDLAAIQQADNDWYAVMYTLRTQADVEAVASWTEGEKKLFGTASADVNIIDTTDSADSTTIAAIFKSLNYARSWVIFGGEASTKFPEGALFGNVLPLDPGSYTLAFKTLVGIVSDGLTVTQEKNALDKNANIYIKNAGVDITREGTVGEGEFIDIIIFVDWLQTRMTERLFTLLIQNPKVAFTDPGIASVESEILAQLQEGIDSGGLAADPAPTVFVPKAVDVSTADKAARQLNDVTFQGTLAGAIHAMTVDGTVSL